MERVQQLLMDMLKGFVSKPDDIQIHVGEQKDDDGILNVVNVKVNPVDVAITVGKGGRTADAIRVVIGLVGFNLTGNRVYVKIDAPKLPRNHFKYPHEEESPKEQ